VGFKVPTGKDERLIIWHAGSSLFEFVKDSKLVFRFKSGSFEDYHTKMNSEVFKGRFIHMLNNLEEPSVIVMGNASYHSALLENYPKNNTKKINLQE